MMWATRVRAPALHLCVCVRVCVFGCLPVHTVRSHLPACVEMEEMLSNNRMWKQRLVDVGVVSGVRTSV